MGIRFRRSFKIAPGVRINLSKSGVSTSLGRRGMTVNLRGRKVTTTVGIPGSGLSYRSSSTIGRPTHAEGATSDTETEQAAQDDSGGNFIIWFWLAVGLVILWLVF